MRPVYSKDPRVERSLSHAVRDGVAFSVQTGGGESYFSAFALFLKASTTEVGILSTLPVLVGSLTQLLSVWIGRHKISRHTVMVTGASLQALVWIPLVLLPFLYRDNSLPILLVCLIGYYAAGNLVTPQWTSLMGDLVPERKRGRYFGRRSRLASVTNFLALAAAGAALHLFSSSGFPVSGFFVIFGVAAIARIVSAYHIGHLFDPGPRSEMHGTPAGFSRSAFVRFSVFYGLMQFAVGIASPFFTVYMLRDLHLSYLAYMALIATSVLAQVVTLGAWGRIGDAFGNRFVLRLTGFVMPLVPIAWLFGHHFLYLLILQIFSGVVWGGFILAASNYVYDLLPPDRRTTWIAGHNVWTNLSLFVGALAGAWLGQMEWLPYPGLLGVFLISGLVRLGVSVLLLPQIIEVGEHHALNLASLVFRATGSRRALRWIRPRRPAARPSPALV